MVSAAHPLVKRRSNRLFRFSSCRYVTKGVISSAWKHSPLSPEISKRGAFIAEVKFGVSSGKLVQKIVCLYFVPEDQMWLCVIFNDNVPTTVRLSYYVSATTTSDCFSKEGQYKALPQHWPSYHTGPSNCIQATGKCHHVLIVLTVAFTVSRS